MVQMANGRQAEPPASTVMAVWVGLIAAGLELLAIALHRTVFHQFAFVGPDVWWTVPLVNLLLFGALGLAFTLAGRAGREAFWWKASLWSSTFLGCLGALLTFTSVHRAALLLLSAGVATSIVRTAAVRRAGFSRVISRTMPWLLIVAVGAGVVVRGNMWWQDRAIAQLPEASPGSPNVLLIVLDTVRAASLSLYGYSRATTPHLEQWAKRGALFTEAFSTAPWTLPSHASMVTGRWESELSTDWTQPLDEKDPTLSEVLAARGYATAGFVANTDYASTETGVERGFAHFEDYTLTVGLILKSSALGRALCGAWPVSRIVGNYRELGRKHAPDISAAFLAWTSRQRRPWFALLNYYDAHRPYQAPEPFNSRFATSEVQPDPRFQSEDDPDHPWTPEDAARFTVAYDGAIAYLDLEMESLFQALRRRGDLDQTLIILTADHGEEFGEHRLYSHGNSLYLASLHVPLIVLAPGRVPAAGVVTTPVSLRDIPATVLDLTGDKRPSPFPGQSLSRFWRTPSDPPEDVVISGVRKTPGHPAWHPVSRGDLIGLAQRQFRYIRNLGDGTEELFDFRLDPWERRDLSTDQASRALLERFRSALERVPRLPVGPGR